MGFLEFKHWKGGFFNCFSCYLLWLLGVLLSFVLQIAIMLQVEMRTFLWTLTGKNNFMIVLFLWCNPSIFLWVLVFMSWRVLCHLTKIPSKGEAHIMLPCFILTDGKICGIQLRDPIFISASAATAAFFIGMLQQKNLLF